MGCWRAGKDYDPDRERSEAKRLRRQLQKERRGAMRELRKDAAFLGEVTHLLSPTCPTSSPVSRSQYHSEPAGSSAAAEDHHMSASCGMLKCDG